MSLFVAGCASKTRPILYPNETYEHVGHATAEEEIQHCVHMAENHGLPSEKEAGEAVRGAVRGSFIGAIIGSAVGWVLGNPGRGAASGAAGRGARGAIGGYEGSGSNDPLFRSFVEACLRDKGFRVLGWK